MRHKKKSRKERSKFTDIDELREYLRERMHQRIEGELPDGLPAEEKKKYKLQMQNLRNALRACIYGDGGEKEFIKGYLRKELLQLSLSEDEMRELLPVHFPERLSAQRKFDILLYFFSRKYGKDGFHELCKKYSFPGEKKREDGTYFEITETDISDAYRQEGFTFSMEDKQMLLCDAVYEGFGHGVIDRLRDLRLDGISGGVSGLPEQFFHYGQEEKEEKLLHSYDSIFVMYHGSTVRLSFLSFKSERELRRVTKSLLRFEAPGELSTYRPYMVNDMKDGSRVFACRPPFSESWAFFVRKFDSAEQKAPEELIQDRGADVLIQALKYFVGGGLAIAITGAQGSGKTTLLKTLVRYINPKYNLRIEESVFELWMRKEFPYRNILTFRETESVNLTEGLDAFRKTDGNCLMMGEIGTIQVAALMIELSQVSEQQLFTHHAMSSEKLIDYFKNALLRTGTYQNEMLALDQVLQAVQIHILCEKDLNGKRYIREISEISREGEESIRPLFRYLDGEYHFLQLPSKKLLERMAEKAGKEEKERIYSFFQQKQAI